MKNLGQIGLVLFFSALLIPEKANAENWAILIGVNDYNQAPDLRFCSADQDALRDHLVKGGFDKRRIVVLSTDAKNKNLLPTHDNIKTQLELTLNLVTEGDIIVFGFSGHGVQIDSKDYLCPSDTDLSKQDTLISLNSVYDSLQKSKASMKLMLVDACKNKVSITKNANVRALGNNQNDIPKGIFMMSSCSPGEMSFEDKKFGHGVWMHFVLEGMRGKADKDGDKKISLSEIAKYTYLNTGLHVRDNFAGKQKPWAKYDGEFATLQFNVAEIKDYKSKLAESETKPNAGTKESVATKKAAVIGDVFKAELDLAMKADGIDSKISLFSSIIADSSFSEPERNLARSFRMKLLTLRGKEGDLQSAIKDAKAAGKNGIPVSVKKDNMQLAVSKDGKVVRTPVKKGEILNISFMNVDSFWVSAVDGDKKKQGWIDKNILYNKAKKLEVADTTEIANAGGSSKNFYPQENDYDYGSYADDIKAYQGEIKAYQSELKQAEKLLNNPFNGLSAAERQMGRRELEGYRRELKQAEEEAKTLERQERIQNIFNGGGRNNGFGGGRNNGGFGGGFGGGRGGGGGLFGGGN